MLTGECSIQYLTQPPSTTVQGCNPYDQNERIRIVLQCVVKRHNYMSDQYDIVIKWFRENTTGAVVNLGTGEPDNEQMNMQFFDHTSIYHETKFLNQLYSPSLLGKYWCQVINTTADPDQPLMMSNVFTLLAPGDSSGSTCTGVQTVNNKTCADLPGVQLTTPLVLITTQLQTLTSTAAVAVSSYHTTHLLISPTPTELIPSTTTAITSLPAPCSCCRSVCGYSSTGHYTLLLLLNDHCDTDSSEKEEEEDCRTSYYSRSVYNSV